MTEYRGSVTASAKMTLPSASTRLKDKVETYKITTRLATNASSLIDPDEISGWLGTEVMSATSFDLMIQTVGAGFLPPRLRQWPKPSEPPPAGAVISRCIPAPRGGASPGGAAGGGGAVFPPGCPTAPTPQA